MRIYKILFLQTMLPKIFFISAVLICFTLFIFSIANSSCRNPGSSSSDSTVKMKNVIDTSVSDNPLNGTWVVDQDYNLTKMQINISKNLSYHWQEILIFSKDTFFLEEGKHYRPRNSNDGVQYLPYEGKNYFKGLYTCRNDSLFMRGRNTDYKYSYTEYEYNINRYYLYKISNDTLFLTDEFSRKYQLIRSIKK